MPPLEAGQDFYRAFGLHAEERDASLVVRCDGRDQDQTGLVEGPRKRLHHVAFAVEDGSLPDWQRHLEGLGMAPTDAPGSVAGDGLWFGDPDGNQARLREGGLAPWRSFGDVRMNFGDAVRRVDQARWQSAGDKPTPRRLGRVLIFTSDLARSEDFYGRALGLRLSDRITGRASFMNVGDHHVFGFIASTLPGLHHSSWEVADIDQIAVVPRRWRNRATGTAGAGCRS